MKPLKLFVTPTRHRRLNEVVGLILLVAAVLLLLSLVSYRPVDASLDTVAATGYPIHNWTGRLGATLSDLLLQVEGASAFGLPLLVSALAWIWLRSRAAASPAVKLVGVVLCLVFGPATFALLPGHLRVFGALPIEGLTGRLLADVLVAQINFPGSCILVASLLGLGIYLTTSFSFNTARDWAVVHFAFLAAWRDRYVNWKLRRAHAKAEKQAARELAAQQKQLDKTRRTEAKESAQKPGLATARGSSRENRADEDAMPARRGGFADIQPGAETIANAGHRPVASGWDNDPHDSRSDAPASMAELAPADIPAPQLAPSPAAGRAYDGIAFSKRADIETRSVTVTQKSVAGFDSAYKLPPSTLLHRAEESQVIREEELRAEAQVLIEKCAEFDVGGQVVQINPGPVVTTFEFRPDAGVKYSRVTGLAEDLCLAMAAESILIERMAGKSTVGIQVPNSTRETIWLRDVIEADNFTHSKSKITIAMGKDINGRIVVADLATMPHVLIAGSTGSGKSVAINAMIMSILYKATPEQVRLILVDPKRVELGMYEGIPHLFTPIITEPKLAANALRNAVREMERRLKLLASKSVRNIDQYNKLFAEGTLDMFDDNADDVPEADKKPLPYIMIIIDELADLMMLDKSNVEEAITRLAQMARAVGIHLVLATQRPSVDVITGLIKANVPTRMSFRLASKTDSRTILDSNGAESLLGRGDMLFLPPGTSRLQRVHAPFVTEKEISGVVAFWKAQGDAQYVEGFLDSPKDDKGRDLDAEPEDENADDELFEDAVRLVFEFGKASTSLLQRRMRIGYGRAAHLIDMMERDGLVGPSDGSKPREILKSPGWINEIDSAMR